MRTDKDAVEPNSPATEQEKTLWDRLGGEENVKKVVDAWVIAFEMSSDRMTRTHNNKLSSSRLFAACPGSLVHARHG